MFGSIRDRTESSDPAPEIKSKLRYYSRERPADLRREVMRFERSIFLRLNEADSDNYDSVARGAIVSANTEYEKHMELGLKAYGLSYNSKQPDIMLLGKAAEEYIIAAYISNDLKLGRDKVISAATQAYNIFINPLMIGHNIGLENVYKSLEIAFSIAVTFDLDNDKVKFAESKIIEMYSILNNRND
jgi:hypothetical protein